MSEYTGNDYPAKESAGVTDEAVYQRDITHLEQKGLFYRRALQNGPEAFLAQGAQLGVADYLQNAHTLTRNAVEFTGSNIARRVDNFLWSSRFNPRDIVNIADQATKRLMAGVDEPTMDIADVIIGYDQFLQVTHGAVLDRPAAENDKKRRTAMAYANLLAEQILIRLYDRLPVERVDLINSEDIERISRAITGQKLPDERWASRLNRMTAELGYMAHVAREMGEIDMDRSERTQIMGLQQRLANRLHSMREAGHRVQPLVVQGADVGIPFNIMMIHPEDYGHHTIGNNVVSDFFLVEPREVHHLPTPTKEYADGIDAHEEKMVLALRLFKDGSIDSGFPLLPLSHRPIERQFARLGVAGFGQEECVYLKALFTALACDNMAPATIIEREAGESVVNAIRGARRLGERVGDFMRRVLIPRVEKVTRSSADWAEEEKADGAETEKGRVRFHTVRAYARRLTQGYKRSEENLRNYEDDIASGYIQRLKEEDDRAIHEGTKSYVAPMSRGSRELGEQTADIAAIGEGATRTVLERRWGNEGI